MSEAAPSGVPDTVRVRSIETSHTVWCGSIRCCQVHDEQSHSVTGFSKSVSSLGLNCPANMASSTSVKEKSCHWDRKETLLLIELYRQNPCLRNVKADVYKDRNKRVVQGHTLN
ncbi:hypothetical protein E2C01_068232 [Portunus trituberculatus]|uniref:Uncharacterized protein n=1 Tax=Portunus trituberculatus TaxID=210409 RepID=A0A5B7HLX6_PORTR|nr:hypothetical protein [Portunus trituberculatus]